MREDAIRFVEAIERWRADHHGADKKTANELAAKLANIEPASLPSGPFGLAMLQARDIASQWHDAPRDGVNNEGLFRWACHLPLGELLERLVLHGSDGATTPRPTVTRSELVNVGRSKGLLGIGTSRLSQMIKAEGFPAPIRIEGKVQTFDIAQVNEWLESHGKTEIQV